jgi:glutamate dehydrogenase
VKKNQAAVERATTVLGEISSADSFDLAILSVALRVIRTLLKANSL